MSHPSYIYATADQIKKLGTEFFKQRNERIEREREALIQEYMIGNAKYWSWKSFRFELVTREDAIRELSKPFTFGDKWHAAEYTGCLWANRVQDLMDSAEAVSPYATMLVDVEVFAILAKYERFL